MQGLRLRPLCEAIAVTSSSGAGIERSNSEEGSDSPAASSRATPRSDEAGGRRDGADLDVKFR